MTGLELSVACLGLLNGVIVLVRPIARIHARLDVLEERVRHIASTLDRIADR